MKPQIKVLTCMNGRERVSEIFIQVWKYVISEIQWADLSLFACVSGKESADLCRKYGIDFVEYENKPLGRKWNYGLEQAGKKDWDYVLITGDDDLISPLSISLYRPYLIADFKYLGFSELHFIDLKYSEALRFGYSKRGQTIGCGRLIQRSICEQLKFNIWPNDRDNNLDSGQLHIIQQSGTWISVVSQDRPGIIDLKSGYNIWGFDKFRPLGQPAKIEDVIWWLPDEYKKLITNYSAR